MKKVRVTITPISNVDQAINRHYSRLSEQYKHAYMLSPIQRKLLLNGVCGKHYNVGIATCENVLRNAVLPHLSARVTVYSSGNLYNGICYIYKNNEGVWRKYSPLTGWVDMNINALNAVLRYWKYNKCPVYTVNNFKEK